MINSLFSLRILPVDGGCLATKAFFEPFVFDAIVLRNGVGIFCSSIPSSGRLHSFAPIPGLPRSGKKGHTEPTNRQYLEN